MEGPAAVQLLVVDHQAVATELAVAVVPPGVEAKSLQGMLAWLLLLMTAVQLAEVEVQLAREDPALVLAPWVVAVAWEVLYWR